MDMVYVTCLGVAEEEAGQGEEGTAEGLRSQGWIWILKSLVGCLA